MSAPAALLLAAGSSRRLGAPKQLVLVDGEPLVRRMARVALAARPSALHVVVGARGDEVFAAVADLGARRVDCRDWEEGMSASLRAGLLSLPAEAPAALVLLCDQVALTSAHCAALVAAWREDPARPVATAHSGVLSVPAILPRTWFLEAAAVRGDRGARDLLRRRAAEVASVDAPELRRDLDEPADLP